LPETPPRRREDTLGKYTFVWAQKSI
jgi:hypothetical protein